MDVVQPLRAYDRDQELSQIGNFNLEEACQTFFAVIDSDDLKMADIEDLNTNMNQLMDSNQVPRGQTGQQAMQQ